MRLLMAFEAGRVLVGLAALSALVRPDIAVCGHVSVQIGDVPECFVADSALVRSGRAVSGLVLLKVCLLPESLLAHLALEWTFTRMNFSVRGQV